MGITIDHADELVIRYCADIRSYQRGNGTANKAAFKLWDDIEKRREQGKTDEEIADWVKTTKNMVLHGNSEE